MELDKDVLARVIREVVEEYTAGREAAPAAPKTTDPSGVIWIDPTRVATQPFPFPIESPPGSVRLVDLVDVPESPRLGCGTMELDSTSFEWTLTYDEVDYVIDGVLELVIDGRTVRAEAGQVLVIPKNTTLRFQAPGKVRFLYVVYPADWSSQ